jgi:FixJ family two-component response regulator
MPGMSGLELMEQLSSRGLAPPVVFLTGNGDVATSVDAMKLGALDFLVKPVEDAVLVAVVRNALARHAGERKRVLEREACRALIGRLSAREREVLAHVARRRLNKQIAADLGIAEQTVKQHRGRVMEKLQVRSVPDLVRVCEASGLFTAPERSGTKACAT